ncbi:MAG: alpha/beta hydrolase [Verrucomicrobiota bacterium]
MKFLPLVSLGLLAWSALGPMPVALSQVYDQRKDIVFAESHGTGLLMDIFVPKGASNGLAIVDVISGAWYSDRGKIRDHTLAGMYDIHCKRGYTVFAVRPGSRTRYTASEMDQHVKTGIRWVKSHAAEHGIDPERIGLTGASAGGHLASLAALTPDAGSPDAKDPLQRLSTRVRAVGVFFPPTDFLDWKDGQRGDPKILGPLLFVGGTEGRSEGEIVSQARSISPFHRASKTDVPFLLIHGDADPVVPIRHSEKLRDAINAAGGRAELIVKKGGGHPWLTLPVEVGVLADWFDRELGAKARAVTDPQH